MRELQKRRLTIGSILILVGVAFLLRPRFEYLDSAYLLLVIGLVFLVAYLWRRRYGLMVPAGILIGLGVGQALEGNVPRFTDGAQLGLGLGFLAVFFVPLAVEGKSHWWPWIPATVLILSAFEGTEDLIRYLFDNWPLILILIGVLLVVFAMMDRRRTAE